MSNKQKSFEEYMVRLQEIVLELEKPDLPLEKSVALYKEGRSISEACSTMLEKAENEITLCTEGRETPFKADPADSSES